MDNLKKILLYSLLFTISQISLSSAEVGRKVPSKDGAFSAGPYYNPATKSYFEMFRMVRGSGQNGWDKASAYAQKKFFKGTQGRLAVAKDLATHQFILRNFSARNFWIGLQYFCGSQTLKWVDGTNAAQSNFSAWDSNWSNTHIRCSDMGYMPVHYTTATTTGALRWRASGPRKAYTMYLVEYPTNGE